MTTEEIKKINDDANAPATPSRADQISQMYDAQKEANRLALENAYNQNMSNAQAAKDKIAPQYQTAANDLAVQFERNRRNFNQQALGSGINTGTASQARLSQSNEYLRDFGKLRSEESNALADAERGIVDLKTQYQNAIASSAADSDFKKAAALLDEYNNQYNRDLAKAQQLAQFGDFSMFATLYGQGAADNMLAVWKAQNPDLAYNTGRITAEEYRNMTGKYPAGYKAPSSGGGGGYYYKPSSTGSATQGLNDIPTNMSEQEYTQYSLALNAAKANGNSDKYGELINTGVANGWIGEKGANELVNRYGR